MKVPSLNRLKKYYRKEFNPNCRKITLSYKKLFLVACFTLTSQFSIAEETAVQNVGRFDIPEVLLCQTKFDDKVNYSACLDSVLVKKQRELSTWNKSMNFKLQEVAELNGRKDAITLFSSSQQEFERFKNKNCKWQYLTLLPDTHIAANMTKECEIYMTIQRTNELKHMSKFDFFNPMY